MAAAVFDFVFGYLPEGHKRKRKQKEMKRVDGTLRASLEP